MVMQEAIKDKTTMMEAQLKNQEGEVVEPEDYAQYDNDGNKYDDHKSDGELDDELDDDFFDDESEKIMRSYKEQRMAEMKEEYEERQTNKTLGHGTYTEIVESEFLPLVTKTRYVIVAFYHQDFERCKIVDMHMQKICRDHDEARIVKMDAERAPFFINKLGIQMLPTIICFVDGVAQDRVVGFEELGGTDEFSTMTLTRRLIRGGVLYANSRAEKGQIKIKKGSNARKADSSSGEDN